MAKSKGLRAAARPTPFGDLNDLLDGLVGGARGALGDNFVGAYLHGSFALGDFDRRSDVDFIVALREDLSPQQLAALQALHAELHVRPNHWAQRLEGSYAPSALLRRRMAEPRDPPGEPRADDWVDPETSGWLRPEVYPFWFVGNGRDRLVRSEHDNRDIPRWILRERGVILAGPNPRTLIDPVPPEAVRAEARTLIDIFDKASSELLAKHIFQSFTAVATARALHSLDTGRVQSKKAAVVFARHRLDPKFASLVERGFAEREQRPTADADMPAYVARPADPADAALTRELLAFAKTAKLGEARALAEQRMAHQRPGAIGRNWRDLRNDRGGRGGGRGGYTPPPTRPGGRRGRG
ncbi:MAG TPA: nucleotidyltransferase domain-containing protein [Caulobacteraceae bacterium]|nr:nucleotidyltransferase domain-containing protein [Caulobacteraceae bacterium]